MSKSLNDLQLLHRQCASTAKLGTAVPTHACVCLCPSKSSFGQSLTPLLVKPNSLLMSVQVTFKSYLRKVHSMLAFSCMCRSFFNSVVPMLL